MIYPNTSSTKFPPKIQNPLNWFAFFLGYPLLSILGSSVTFYIFIYVLLFSDRRIMSRTFEINKWPKKLFFIFGLIVFLSLVFAPWAQLRTVSSQPIIIFIQLLYWLSLGMFIVQYYNYIDKEMIFKYLSIGIVLQTVAFYILKDFNINLGPVKVDLAHFTARNALNFQLIALGPILIYYLRKINTSIFLAGMVFLVSAALFTGGRAGSIIVFFQCLLFWGNKVFLKPVYILFLTSVVIFINLFAVDFDNYITLASYKIEPYNERLAEFMRGQAENTILEEDRSLLEREIHRNKGSEIFKKYPFFGLGFGNYGNFDAELNFLSESRFLRMRGNSVEYLNKRSAHNSYVQIISETGGLGFLFFLLCVIPAAYILYTNAKYNLFSATFFISILGMMSHLYAITAAYGAVFWFIIAFANAAAFYTIRQVIPKKISYA